MGQHKIPLKDKEIVKKRLAKGKSYRQAIKGTVIKSPNTVTNIVKEEKDNIRQLRQNYISLIESFDAKDIDRAKLWADMTRATKLFGKNAVEHADWTNRGEALKYIDSLKGISSSQTNINFSGDKVIALLGNRKSE